MTQRYIRYRSGYKYQLVEEDYEVQVSVKPKSDIKTKEGLIELNTEGMLVIKKGYAWDGASGPAPDVRSIMRGSLVHDALYQLMRREYLDGEEWQDEADAELRRICREDGMPRILAQLVYKAVRRWGKMAADPENRKKVHTAPSQKRIQKDQ